MTFFEEPPHCVPAGLDELCPHQCYKENLYTATNVCSFDCSHSSHWSGSKLLSPVIFISRVVSFVGSHFICIFAD